MQCYFIVLYDIASYMIGSNWVIDACVKVEIEYH